MSETKEVLPPHLQRRSAQPQKEVDAPVTTSSPTPATNAQEIIQQQLIKTLRNQLDAEKARNEQLVAENSNLKQQFSQSRETSTESSCHECARRDSFPTSQSLCSEDEAESVAEQSSDQKIAIIAEILKQQDARIRHLEAAAVAPADLTTTPTTLASQIAQISSRVDALQQVVPLCKDNVEMLKD